MMDTLAVSARDMYCFVAFLAFFFSKSFSLGDSIRLTLGGPLYILVTGLDLEGFLEKVGRGLTGEGVFIDLHGHSIVISWKGETMTLNRCRSFRGFL